MKLIHVVMMTCTAWETLAVPNKTVGNAQQSLQPSIRHSLLVADRPTIGSGCAAGLRQVDRRVWVDVPMAAAGLAEDALLLLLLLLLMWTTSFVQLLFTPLQKRGQFTCSSRHAALVT